jgi:rhamnosyl/mannosyltransferase
MNDRIAPTPALRVCHLGKYYPPASGGIESHVRTLALAQAELGLDVRVFCVNHREGPTAREKDADVEVTRFAPIASAAKLDVCPDLVPALRRLEVDVLHLHVPNPTMILALLRAASKAPLVVTYHSDIVRQRVLGALFRPFERLAYRKARAVMPTSPYYAGGSSFLERYADRLRVLPHGIDLGPYVEPSPAHLAEAAKIREAYPGPRWLGCGRLVYYKGFLNAVRAMPLVPGVLLLIGDGPERRALEDEAKRLGVADRVVFLGNLPHYLDLIPYYLAADAFWFPSNERSEAFGLVQVEAMACGLPVINAAIPHSGVAWVSPNEQTGLTVPVDDPAALAQAATRLMSEPGLRDRLGAAARDRASGEFNHRVMAERSLEIYRQVLDAPQPSRPLPDREGVPAP